MYNVNFFLQIFLRGKTSVVILFPEVLKSYLFGEIYFFKIPTYRHCSHIYFRMTIIHMSRQEKKNIIIYLFGTHCTLDILFLYIIFIVSQSIFKFSLVIMTF